MGHWDMFYNTMNLQLYAAKMCKSSCVKKALNNTVTLYSTIYIQIIKTFFHDAIVS